jgi:hypothetical protein
MPLPLNRSTGEATVLKVSPVMLSGAKHPCFRQKEWILQSLRSFRMTIFFFPDNQDGTRFPYVIFPRSFDLTVDGGLDAIFARD